MKLPLNRNRNRYPNSKAQADKERLLLERLLNIDKAIENAQDLLEEDKELINKILEAKNKLLNKKKEDKDA